MKYVPCFLIAAFLLVACQGKSVTSPTLHPFLQEQTAVGQEEGTEGTPSPDVDSSAKETPVRSTDEATRPSNITKTATDKPGTQEPTPSGKKPTQGAPTATARTPTQSPESERGEKRETLSFEDAQAIEPSATLLIGEFHKDKMAADQEPIAFVISLYQNDQVIVQLQRLKDGGNLSMTFYDPQGALLFDRDTGPEGGILFTNPLMVTQPGDYLLVITGQGAEYQVTIVNVRAPAATATIEPVGQSVSPEAPTAPLAKTPFPDGGRIEINQSVWAELKSDGEKNRFTIAATAGSNAKIVANPDPNNPGTLNPYLTLQAPNGEVVAENDDWSPGIPDAYLEYTFDATGIYTVYVTSSQGQGMGFYYLSISDGYTIRDVERGAAQPDTPNSAVLETFGARDIWTMQLQAGDVIDLSAQAVDLQTFDIMVEIVAPGGQSWFDDDGGEGTNALLAGVVAPETGEYRIHVAGNDNASRGAYELLWSRNSP